MESATLALSVDEIRLLSNYAHWIPVIHGYTDEYMKENYPGWSWNDLIPKLVRLNLISTNEHPGDTKLWQGLWLKAGINEIAVSKVGKTVMFEAVLE